MPGYVLQQGRGRCAHAGQDQPMAINLRVYVNPILLDMENFRQILSQANCLKRPTMIFNSVILEVAIGLFLVFFLVAMLSSGGWLKKSHDHQPTASTGYRGRQRVWLERAAGLSLVEHQPHRFPV